MSSVFQSIVNLPDYKLGNPIGRLLPNQIDQEGREESHFWAILVKGVRMLLLGSNIDQPIDDQIEPVNWEPFLQDQGIIKLLDRTHEN